jgi:hypothetical protein
MTNSSFGLNDRFWPFPATRRAPQCCNAYDERQSSSGNLDASDSIHIRSSLFRQTQNHSADAVFERRHDHKRFKTSTLHKR